MINWPSVVSSDTTRQCLTAYNTPTCYEIRSVSLQFVTSSDPLIEEKNSLSAFWEGNVAMRMLRAVMDISKRTTRKSLSDCPVRQTVPARAK